MPSKAEIKAWREELTQSASVEIANTTKALEEDLQKCINTKALTIDDIKGVISDDIQVLKKSFRKLSLSFHPDKAIQQGLNPSLFTMLNSYYEYRMKPTNDDLSVVSNGIKSEMILERALASIQNLSNKTGSSAANLNAAKDAELLRKLQEQFQKEAEEKEALEKADADLAREIYEQEKAEAARRLEKQKKEAQEKRDAILAKAIADELALEESLEESKRNKEEELSARKAQELEAEDVRMHMPIMEEEVNVAEEQAEADRKAAEEAKNWQATMDLLAAEEAAELANGQRRRSPSGGN